MSDLIERQAAIDATWKDPSYTDPLNVLTEIRDRIKALPSAQPEIIRCKDCKHWKDSDGVYRRGIGAESKCPMNIWPVYDGVFYCGYAERRTDD